MAMQTYTFSGEVKWCKLQQPDEKYGKYSLDIKLSEADAKLFQSLGLKNGIKDGYVTLRRDPKKLVWKGEEQVPLGPPLVVDDKGEVYSGLIGNGSTCTCKFVVNEFTSKKWGPVKSTWLDAVRVDKLVEFKKVEPTMVPTEGVKPRIMF